MKRLCVRGLLLTVSFVSAPCLAQAYDIVLSRKS